MRPGPCRDRNTTDTVGSRVTAAVRLTAAATELEMLRAGVVPVRVEILELPAK